jgi:hypothetical protein
VCQVPFRLLISEGVSDLKHDIMPDKGQGSGRKGADEGWKALGCGPKLLLIDQASRVPPAEPRLTLQDFGD